MVEIIIMYIGFAMVSVPAYLTHVVWYFTSASENQMYSVGSIILAVLGVIFPPVGAIHGYMLWFQHMKL